MDDMMIARALHVLAVLMWIGGVGFVTLVIMPNVTAAAPPEQRLARFHEIENRFARQAQFWVLLAGLSGLWLVWRGDLWSRFADLQYWWMHAMVALWTIFAAMLFVIEPLALHRRMAASPQPASDFARMVRLHRLLLVLGLATLLGAVAGSHGMYF